MITAATPRTRRVRGAMHERTPEGWRPVPNTLERRLTGQCPYCLHYGTDCHCHKRKTMPVSRIFEQVYLVTEDEPDTGTEFPSVVVGVYKTKAGAEARVAYERKTHHLEEDAAYEDAAISWNIETQEVWP